MIKKCELKTLHVVELMKTAGAPEFLIHLSQYPEYPWRSPQKLKNEINYIIPPETNQARKAKPCCIRYLDELQSMVLRGNTRGSNTTGVLSSALLNVQKPTMINQVTDMTVDGQRNAKRRFFVDLAY